MSLLTPLRLRAGHRMAHSLAKPQAGQASSEWLIERMSNGVQLACHVSPQATAPVQLRAVFRAGARHEDHSPEAGETGMSHLLRRSVGLSTDNASGFALVRSLQQMGASFDCSASREHMVFDTRLFNLKLLPEAANFLAQASTACHFYAWELSSTAFKYMKKDLDFLYRQNFDQLLVELLHKAAYRKQPLGNSLFAPEWAMTRGYTEAALMNFQERLVTAPRLTLLATAGGNVCRDAPSLLDKLRAVMADGKAGFKLHPDHSASSAASSGGGGKCSVISGGDERYEQPLLELAMVAVAWEGLPMGHKDQWALSVLLSAVGGPQLHRPRVAYSDTAALNGTLSRAIAASKNESSSAAIGALQWAYADSGLAGFELVGQRRAVAEALPKAWHEIQRVAKEGITDAQLAQAKAAVKTDVLLSLESPAKAAQHVGEELSLTGHHTPQNDLLSALDKLTRADVQRVAEAVFGKKSAVAMSAVGDIHGVPCLTELQRTSQ